MVNRNVYRFLIPRIIIVIPKDIIMFKILMSKFK